jgi:hypothetical protein
VAAAAAAGLDAKKSRRYVKDNCRNDKDFLH